MIYSVLLKSADEQMVAALKTGAVDIVRRILEGKQGKIPHKHIPNEGYVAQTVEEWVKSPSMLFISQLSFPHIHSIHALTCIVFGKQKTAFIFHTLLQSLVT